MDDDLERLSRLLDDLAAEHDPHDRADLSPDEAEWAETAALLKAARADRSAPREEFIDRLGAQLAAARSGEPPEPADTARPSGLSRRGLLGRLATGAAGLAAGAGIGAAAAYNRGRDDGYRQEVRAPFDMPLAPEDRGQWLNTGHTAAGVSAGQAVRFHVGAIEGFLVNPGGGKPLYALSAACTHMGCLISWLDSAGSFLCPCHGAQYNADGTVLNGIARQPLPRLRVRTDADGHLSVWAVTAHPAITTVAPYPGS